LHHLAGLQNVALVLPALSWRPVPGASIPARKANEVFSRVGKLGWRTTTSPATIPKATCEAMNQSRQRLNSGQIVPACLQHAQILAGFAMTVQGRNATITDCPHHEGRVAQLAEQLTLNQ
jgi:hypothetical protein